MASYNFANPNGNQGIQNTHRSSSVGVLYPLRRKQTWQARLRAFVVPYDAGVGAGVALTKMAGFTGLTGLVGTVALAAALAASKAAFAVAF